MGYSFEERIMYYVKFMLILQSTLKGNGGKWGKTRDRWKYIVEIRENIYFDSPVFLNIGHSERLRWTVSDLEKLEKTAF